MDSTYFCLTSLLKVICFKKVCILNTSKALYPYYCNSSQIGFGDFVPGSSNAGQVDMQLYVDYCYLLVGLAIVAMNYYMLKEEVLHKSLKFKRKLSEFCHKLMSKIDE